MGVTACSDKRDDSSIFTGIETEQDSSIDNSSSSVPDSSNNNGENSSSEHTHNYIAVTTNPTCTTQGFTAYTCVCGDDYIADYVNALNHEFTNYISDNNAKCEVNGTETATCSRQDCNETDTRTEENSALTHDFTNYISDNNATYEKDGTKTAVCNHDGCNVTDIITDAGTKLISEISFKTLSINGMEIYGKVSNDTEEFSFIDEVVSVGIAKYVVSLDVYGIQQVATKIIPLAVGDNSVYIIEQIDGEPTKTYNVVIRRRPLHQVTFETNGGTKIQSQMVEEDSFASLPNEPTKIGYTFSGWNWNFNSPIINDNTIISANWQINQYTLTLSLDNGDKDIVIKQDYNSEISIQKPERAGYGFIGWNITPPQYMPAEDLAFTAQWESIFSISNNTITGLTSFGLTYNTIDIPNKIDDVMITSIANAAFKNCTLLTNITIANGITYIGREAFEYCYNLEGVILPQTIQSIEAYSFNNCTKLENIILPNGITKLETSAFYNCKNLASIEIPTSVEVIRDTCFYACEKLTICTIPKNVTYIGSSIFGGCRQLASIFVDENNLSYKDIDGALYTKDSKILLQFPMANIATSLEIPSKVTQIQARAFEGNRNLVRIAIEHNVTTIENYAFYNCIALSTLEISGTIKNIGDYSFANCTQLIDVTIGNTLEKIGFSAFSNCNKLEKITLPFVGSQASISPLGYMNFGYIFGGNWYDTHKDCVPKSLKSVVLTGSFSAIDSYAFANCSSLTSVTFPNNVRKIGDHAFLNCTNLTSIELPNGLNEIEDYVFSGCGNLQEIIIPNSVTKIGHYSFENCSSLQSLNIPNNLTNIGLCAFAGCSNLQQVVIPNSVTLINYGAFKNCYNLTIYCMVSDKPEGWESGWNSLDYYGNYAPVIWNNES